MNEAVKKKIIKWFWVILCIPVLLVAALLLLVWAFADIPSFAELENPESNLATQVIAQDGEVLATFHIENRSFVSYDELSPYLVQAAVATEDQRFYNSDGVIICMDIPAMNKHLPPIYREQLLLEKCNIFTMDMMEKTAHSLDQLKGQEVLEKPFALFFEPASVVDRIANQYALFSVVSDVRVPINAIEGANEAMRKIIIPARVKLEIRDKLDYINISERMIYPGLDGICKWITRRFANLGPRYNAGGPNLNGKEPPSY